jgi:hypothetical protein
MTQPAAQRSFDLGRVIQDAFGAIRHNLATFAILTLILAGIPAVFWGLGVARVIGGVASLTTGALSPWRAIGAGLELFSGGFIISLVANAILQAAVTYGVAAHLNGQPAGLGPCLSAGLRSCLPLIGMMILFGLAVWIGLIFLIVPGVMMAVAWIVAAPVIVVERTGVFAAFSRSADLTRGRRWAVFALGVLFFIAVGVVQQVVVSLVQLAIPPANPVAQMTASLPVSAAFSLVVGVLSPALIAATYYELRASREGVGPESLAAVFD